MDAFTTSRYLASLEINVYKGLEYIGIISSWVCQAFKSGNMKAVISDH